MKNSSDTLRSAGPAPVAGRGRIEFLDLVRGCALLGILLVNVWAFALPFPESLDPHLTGFDTTANHLVHGLVFMVAYVKTMPLFGMLFGAGILVFCVRLEQRGVAPLGVFARRQLWLLVFGLVHAYLMWNGDILVPYAVTGLIVYRARHWRPRTLLILAMVLMAAPKLTMGVGGTLLGKLQEATLAAEQAYEAGEELTDDQQRVREIGLDMESDWSYSPEQAAELNEIMRGGYWGIRAHEAEENLGMHFFMYPLVVGWDIAGIMVLGMALFKTGVLTGRRSRRHYLRLLVLGYGVGLPASALSLWLFHRDFSLVPLLQYAMPLSEAAGVLVAVGHVSLLALLYRGGRLRRAGRRLMAVGRMAFSNYLGQTTLGILLFHGFGFGRFGTFDRVTLLGVAIAIWIVQLAFSPWWLRRFRNGPVEWLWRSLVYRRRLPLVRGD